MPFFKGTVVSTVRGAARKSLSKDPKTGSLPRCFASRHSYSSVVGETKVDQTKKSNDPSKSHKDEHQTQAKMSGSDEGRDHPAKQPDPQPSPSKSTGVETEGPGSRSGAGQDKEVSKDRGAGPFMKQ